eukprot:10417857-Alexandrium_andersonii.AAC.1
MSASLVGSEMCIRDRAWPRTQTRGRRSVKAPMEGGLGGGERRTGGVVPRCLLYTSDAADDM